MKLLSNQTLFSHQGRMTRTQFWLLNLLIYPLLGVLATLCGAIVMIAAGSSVPTSVDGIKHAGGPVVFIGVAIFVGGILSILYSSIVSQIKRWHDQDKSGWWFLINFVPLVGSLICMVMCGFFPGSKGENLYGPDPRGAAAA